MTTLEQQFDKVSKEYESTTDPVEKQKLYEEKADLVTRILQRNWKYAQMNKSKSR